MVSYYPGFVESEKSVPHFFAHDNQCRNYSNVECRGCLGVKQAAAIADKKAFLEQESFLEEILAAQMHLPRYHAPRILVNAQC